jgi:hypothetical protein
MNDLFLYDDLKERDVNKFRESKLVDLLNDVEEYLNEAKSYQEKRK